MKRLLIISIIATTANCLLPTADCFTQAPAIEWQNTIGANLDDLLWTYSLEQTDDGGYIVGGFSKSGISGDKTEVSLGDYDVWIVKLDNSGNIEWQNTIGGSGIDYFRSIFQTSDGGYIIGAESYSGISGDKTENSNGSSDIWIIKIDELGNIEWQNTIGGTSSDNLSLAFQTIDDGFFVGGYSQSGISGDKTEGNIGTYDFWIIKLDSDGNIIWQNTIGGNSYDALTSAGQTSDGGFIIGGFSSSGISGDKSEPSLGNHDFWVLKISSIGNIVWQNTIGGSSIDYLYNLHQTQDGGYILGGTSTSNISGDKTEASFGEDFWVVKLNSLGFIEWQNSIGGSSNDWLNSIHETYDGGYLLGGYSFSPMSGDKSENIIGGVFNDNWLVKLNATGNIEWENSIGGTDFDGIASVIQTNDGGYVALSGSSSNISGDKTENSNGISDYWLIKLFPDCIPTPELCNSLDDNCNGLIDDAITETISIFAGGPITFCQGGNVLLSATYSGATVQWKKNGTNIPGATSPTYLVNSKGTYTCETTSACDTELSTGIFVNVQKNPPASITAGGATTFCEGGSVVLTANAGGGLSYQWYKGASLIAGATSINYTATIAGNYKCRVTKTATGCFKNSNVISVSVPCKEGEGINYNNLKFTIYPNPASEILSVFINTVINDNSSLIITDITGKTISSFEITSSILELNIYNYAKGIYFINLNINGEILTEKFIKD